MTGKDTIQHITNDIYHRIYGISFKDNPNISIKDLRYLTPVYYGFDHQYHVGEMIVHASIAKAVICVFKELCKLKYPIEKIHLIDDYNGDDELSMADNNTSCFNYRTISSSNKLSNHSFGLAIDINPLYNPYIFTQSNAMIVLPIEGEPYTDRSLPCPYYIHKNDYCYAIFKKYGFTWGGDWTTKKDYQHFEHTL